MTYKVGTRVSLKDTESTFTTISNKAFRVLGAFGAVYMIADIVLSANGL